LSAEEQRRLSREIGLKQTVESMARKIACGISRKPQPEP